MTGTSAAAAASASRVVTLVLVRIGGAEARDGAVELLTGAHVGRDREPVARARVHPRQRPPAGARVGEQARLRQRREVGRRLPVPQLADVEVVLLAVEPQAALPAEPA